MNKKEQHQIHINGVREFYNTNHHKFEQVYGEVIQAFRTNDLSVILDSQMESMRLEKGMNVLDAGCGICGPARYFAHAIPDLKIQACTLSKVQAQIASERIENENLSGRISVHIEDYHEMEQKFGKDNFDLIYFLESFGHSPKQSELINAVWNTLKPGGSVYIKDLFKRESNNEWEQLRIDHICNQINEGYKYCISDLNTLLSTIRKKGFILHFVKTPQIKMSDFEQLTISNDFQNLFDISKIDGWDDYVFPIDFFEILAQKPSFDLNTNMHLYHMNRS